MSVKYKSWAALILVIVVMSFSAAQAQADSGSYGGAEIPVIVTQPQGATLVGENDTVTLSIEAFVSDGGELSYSWYVCGTENRTEVGACKPISPGDSSGNKLLVSNPGTTVYYYAEVLNVAWVSGSLGKAWVESDMAKVVGTQRQDATTPIISGNPRSESTIVGKSWRDILSVRAVAVDGGTLSYQWFSNTERADTGWTLIDGATESSYDPDVSKAGTTYYRVVVTNTNNAVSGNKTASRTSYVAALRVEEVSGDYAAFPNLSELKTVPVDRDDDTVPVLVPILSIDAESPDGGTLSYQWYKTPYESDVGGEPIEGATDPTFDPSVGADVWSPVYYYYYVEVTNTKSGVGEDAQRAVAASAPVGVSTSAPGITAVKTRDRVVPSSNRKEETAAMDPTNTLTAGVAVGPNPVSKSFGAVSFFRSGSRITSASLYVYDAFGNVVKKIAIRDDAVGNNNKQSTHRNVGSWDLRDSKGRTVPEGTYLLKGTVKASGGKTERVSAVVGIR